MTPFGTTRATTEVWTQRECDVCGELATHRHGFTLPNARLNPMSTGYRKDDISWCSDAEAFTCATCKVPSMDGYEWCSTFDLIKFPHMAGYWRKTNQTEEQPS